MIYEATFGIISFIANVLWAMTGFGNSIVFLFLYQMADFTPLFDDLDEITLKYAILIQSICLIGPILYLGVRISIKQTFDKYLVMPLAIMTLIFTPLGTWLQTYIEDIYMYFILEGTLIVMACGLLLKCKKRKIDREKLFKHMLAVGTLSGLLGGLIGVRSPPVLAYFLFYKYDKDAIRTCGYLTNVINMSSRIIIYATTSPPQPWRNDQVDLWLVFDDWPIYVTVICSSTFGAVLGDYFRTEKTKGLYIGLLISTFVSILSKIILHY